MKIPKNGPWYELESLGFTRRGDSDDLFAYATPPEGWRLEPTDDPAWSTIVDTRGFARVSIFHKDEHHAAFTVDQIGWRVASNTMRDSSSTPRLPDCWDLLTEDEKTQCAMALADRLSTELAQRKYFDEQQRRLSDERIARVDAIRSLVGERMREYTGGTL